METVVAKKSERGVTPPRNEAQTDHIFPRSEGGTNAPSNAAHACRECNRELSNSPKPSPRGEQVGMAPARPDEDRVRVLFSITPDEDGYPPVRVEGLWARRQTNGNIVLDNIPFYAMGVGAGDEVSVKLSPGNKAIWFDSIVKSGGTSVFRIFSKDIHALDQIKMPLLALGCPSEVDEKMGLIAFEVPSGSDIAPVLDFLMSGQSEDRFDFEEGVLRHALPESGL